MNGFVCGTCGFISIDGSAPEKCPVCTSPKSGFEDNANAILEPQDPQNMTELEKKHVPVVVVNKQCGLVGEGCTDVHVKMGEIIHPMQDDHYIVRVDFYLDKRFIGRAMLTPNLNPAAAVHIKSAQGKLSVVEFCNKHGSWIKEVDL